MFFDSIPFVTFDNEEQKQKFYEEIKSTVFDVEMEYENNYTRFSETDRPKDFELLYRNFLIKNIPNMIGFVVVNPITREMRFFDLINREEFEYTFEDLDEWYGLELEQDIIVDFHFHYDEEFSFSVYHNKNYNESTPFVAVNIVYNERDFEKFMNTTKLN